MPDAIHNLIEIFRRFPGIGPRQAKRFTYYLLRQGGGAIGDLIDHLQKLKISVLQCRDCQRFFSSDNPKQKNCQLCLSSQRATSVLIVEKDVDLETIEKSGTYTGRYFVLGGLIPILEQTPRLKIRWTELVQFLTKLEKQNELKEIIIALAANLEGDHTAGYLGRELKQFFVGKPIKISILGRGLSTGAELEYSDIDTLKSALENRQIFSTSNLAND